jgi:DUF971 family protein
MMEAPEKIEIIGEFLALRWRNGKELFIDSPTLRANSPSAEQAGESDIFGKISGGSELKEFCGVTIKKFEYVGNYAIRLLFSDGHGSGIYSWDYLSGIEPN